MDLETKFEGILRISRFAGVKAGRSIWTSSTVRTRAYSDLESARSEILWLIDNVAPAMNVRILGYTIESFLDTSDNLPNQKVL